MTTIAAKGHYKVQFNGRDTWIIVDTHGCCDGYFNTERKAMNALARFTKHDAE